MLTEHDVDQQPDLDPIIQQLLADPTGLHEIEVMILTELQSTWRKRCKGCVKMLLAIATKAQTLRAKAHE